MAASHQRNSGAEKLRVVRLNVYLSILTGNQILREAGYKSKNLHIDCEEVVFVHLHCNLPSTKLQTTFMLAVLHMVADIQILPSTESKTSSFPNHYMISCACVIKSLRNHAIKNITHA